MVEDRADRRYQSRGCKAAGFADKAPAELAKSCQPAGHWIALPLQVYRINTLFMSAKGMQRAGVTKAPASWAEFNDTAEKMKAAGMIPRGQWRHPMG